MPEHPFEKHDPDTQEYLDALTEGSRSTRQSALLKFEVYLHTLPEYAASAAPIKDFIDKVAADYALPVRQKKRIARNTLKGFVASLTAEEKASGSIHTYVTAVQSVASYFETPITTKFVKMPRAKSQTKSHPWNPKQATEFIERLETPRYQSLFGSFYQSGIRIGDVLLFNLDVIKVELEAGIVPICIDMNCLKTGVDCRAFLGPESIALLRVYFKEQPPQLGQRLFPITERAVQDYFARRAKAMIGGWPYRCPMSPHSVRKVIRTTFTNHGCPESYTEYLMAHQLNKDLRKTYTAMSDDAWRFIYLLHMKAVSFKVPKTAEAELKITDLQAEATQMRLVKMIKAGELSIPEDAIPKAMLKELKV